MPQTVATAIDPGFQQQQLRQRLASVRRRLRFATTFRGGSWLPALAGVALQRFVAPFGDRAWPRKTRIELDDVPQWIGRNQPFEVSGRVLGVIPENATVVFKLDGDHSEERQVCRLAPEKDSEG